MHSSLVILIESVTRIQVKIDHQKNKEGHHQKGKANQQILALEKIKSKILQSSHHNMASTIKYRESVAISRGKTISKEVENRLRRATGGSQAEHTPILQGA